METYVRELYGSSGDPEVHAVCVGVSVTVHTLCVGTRLHQYEQVHLAVCLRRGFGMVVIRWEVDTEC